VAREKVKALAVEAREEVKEEARAASRNGVRSSIYIKVKVIY